MFGFLSNLLGSNPLANPKAWILTADRKQLNKAIDQISVNQMLAGQQPDPWTLLGQLPEHEQWQVVGMIAKASGNTHPLLEAYHLPETNSAIADLFGGVEYQQFGQAELLDQAQLPESGYAANYFDWSNIHHHAHTAIIGSTGTGKTTLTTWLASQLQGEALVIDPHYCAGDWSGLHVVGAGQNYSEVADVMQLALGEMARRYKLRNQGQREFTPLTLIIEEVGSIADDPASAETCKYFLPKMLRESRKTGIKLFLLNHGGEVDQWGLKGKGSIRACMNIVRLGEFAIDYAKSTKDQAIIDTVNQMQRPAMVDRLPALVPDLTGFALPSSARIPPGFLVNDSFGHYTEPDITPDCAYFQTFEPRPNPPRPIAVDTPSCIEAASNLSEPLQKLVEFAHRKQGDWVKPSDIKAGIWAFRSTPTDEIRNYFGYLASKGIGETNDNGSNLEYRCIC
jgi:hypothetical protein